MAKKHRSERGRQNMCGPLRRLPKRKTRAASIAKALKRNRGRDAAKGIQSRIVTRLEYVKFGHMVFCRKPRLRSRLKARPLRGFLHSLLFKSFQANAGRYDIRAKSVSLHVALRKECRASAELRVHRYRTRDRDVQCAGCRVAGVRHYEGCEGRSVVRRPDSLEQCRLAARLSLGLPRATR